MNFRDFFDSLTESLFGSQLYTSYNYKGKVIKNMSEFLQLLNNKSQFKTTYFFLLDNFTSLSKISNFLIPGFVRLNDILTCQSRNRCCVILIDQVCPVDFSHILRNKENDIFFIYFPQYTSNELIELLMKNKFNKSNDLFLE